MKKRAHAVMGFKANSFAGNPITTLGGISTGDSGDSYIKLDDELSVLLFPFNAIKSVCYM